MSCQRLPQQMIGVTLVMLLLVGCGVPAGTPVSEAPAAASTLIRPTATPTNTPEPTDTPTPVPPAATPTPTQTAASPTHTLVPVTPTALPPTPSPPPHTSVPATETTLPPILAIRSFLEDQASTGQFSGSVLIAQEEIPVLREAYGLADRSFGIPNQIDTKFNLGSMDKMFTAVAIMQLVEKGKLSLHEEIREFLPNYPNPEIADAVTIHELLIHVSGLGNYFDSPLYLDRHDQIRSIADYLPLFANTPLQLQPGLQFSYSNSGYIVLGLIIEAVSGQSYYDYVREKIFEPSGMCDTACYELDAGTANLAIGYTTFDWNDIDTGQISDNSSMLPMRGGSAGGGYSTAPDLLSFRNALLNYQLLSAESTELVTKGRIQLGDELQYAYGFLDGIVRGYRMIGHTGGFQGVCSMLSMYPDLGYTIIILANSDDDCLVANEFITETLLK